MNFGSRRLMLKLYRMFNSSIIKLEVREEAVLTMARAGAFECKISKIISVTCY